MRSDDLEQLIRELPASQQEVLTAARKLDIEGRSQTAVELLEAAVETYPSQTLRKSLAALYRKVGRLDACGRVLEAVLQESPDDIPSLLLYTEVQLRRSATEPARQSLERAARLGASKTRVEQLRRRLQAAEETEEEIETIDSAMLIDAEVDLEGSDGSSSGPPGPPPLPGGQRAAPDEELSTEEMPSPLLNSSPTDSGLESMDSSIFEDGTFSNLSSQSLAEGAAALEENEESSVFDTLVNHDYDEDDPDRSFDALLVNLGVEMEGPATVGDEDETLERGSVSLPKPSRLDPPQATSDGDKDLTGPDERTQAVDLDARPPLTHEPQSHVDDEQPLDEAPTAVSPSEHEPSDEDEAQQYDLTRDAPASAGMEDAPLDEAPTDLAAPSKRPVDTGETTLPFERSAGLAQDSNAQDVPNEEFPEELPTQIEPEQQRQRRRATQRQQAVSKDPQQSTDSERGEAQRDAPVDGPARNRPPSNRGREQQDSPPLRQRPDVDSGGPGFEGQQRSADHAADPSDRNQTHNQLPSNRASKEASADSRQSRNDPAGRRRGLGAANRSGQLDPNQREKASRGDRASGSPFDQSNVPAPSAKAPDTEQKQLLDEVLTKSRQAWSALKDKLPGSTIAVAIPVVVTILLATFVGVGAWAMNSLGDSLERDLREARRQQRVDTYQGYLAAEQTLENTRRRHSFAGEAFDSIILNLGLNSRRVESSREAALAELALLASMVEFRYEKLDARRSLEHIERVEALGVEDPRIPAARAYRALTAGEVSEARQILDRAGQDYPRSKKLSAALIELELESNRPKAAYEASALFRDTEQYDAYPKFLLARIALARGQSEADNRFRRILRDSSPKHLSARIEQSYAIRQGEGSSGASTRARALVQPVVGKFSDRASPLQLARAHNALGEIRLSERDEKLAEKEFKKAIEQSPTRGSIHLPLIDMYLDAGRSQQALSSLERAVERAGGSASLSIRRARVLRLQGRFEDALETLEGAAVSGEAAEYLVGMCHLDLGQPEKAQSAFDSAVEASSGSAYRARAFSIVAGARASSNPDDVLLEDMKALVDDSDDDPVVLRAGALLHMVFGEGETGYSEQRELFADAAELLSAAKEERAEWAIAAYDMCRIQMRLGEGSQAFAHCKRAKKLNDRYRPGVITSIKLSILRGHYDEATADAGALSKAFPDAPDVSFAKIRAMVAQREVSAAEKEIDRWAGKDVADTHAAKMVEGLLAFHRNDYRRALGYFEQAHKSAPHDAEAAVYYGWTAGRLGEDDGEEILKDRLSDPLWGPRAWQALGELRYEQGKLDDARENFGEALEDYSTSIAPKWRISETYASLARAWAAERDWDHYLTRRFVSRAATRGDDESIPAHMIRGEYHLKKRRDDVGKAIEHFERVLAREPFNCAAIEALIDIYSDLNRDDDRDRVDELGDKYCD